MIKEFFNHPEPFHSHSGHVGMDSRGESIKLSIFKLATVLGDHVSNTDIHVQSSITDEEIDDIVDVPSDSAQKATEYVTSEFLKQMYYTKMDIDQMGFLKQIPDGFATEDYVNDRIRTQKEELEKYAASLIGDYVKPDDYNIFQNTVNSKLNTLTDKYVSLDQRVTGLSSDVSSLKSDVSSLKTRVSVLEKNGTGGSGTGGEGSDNPGGSGTGGNSDSHKKTTVTYMPTVTQTTKGSYKIGTLYVDGEESTIWGKDNASTTISGSESVDSVKCATIQAYKAEKPNVTNINKPGAFTTDNDTHLQITIFPVGWYSTLAQAVNAFGSNNASLWVSQITLYSDGTNSGWSTPQMYVNVQGLIQQATNDAQKYYENQLESANSEINNIIANANAQLKRLEELIKNGDEGHPDSSWRDEVTEIFSQIHQYGWTIDGGKVKYVDMLYDAIIGKIQLMVSQKDGNDLKSAIQELTAEFIKQRVYNYDNGDIQASTVTLTPENLILHVLEGAKTNPKGDVGTALNSAVIDIIKDKITLSVARGEDGEGTQFTLGFDGNGHPQATLDAKNFVITGNMIAQAIYANGISIHENKDDNGGFVVASISSDGEARFGKGTTIFHPNGDAQLAGGNITWNANGNLQVTGDITANSMSVACKDFKKDDISSADSNKMWFTNYASAKKISNGEIQNAQVELKDSDPVILFKREDNGASRFFALSPLPLVKSGGDSFEQVVINCTDSISELPITFKNKHYFKSKTTGIYYDEPDIYTSSRPTTYKWNHSEQTNFVYDGFVYQNKNIYFGSSVDTVSFVQNRIRKHKVYIDYIESGQIKHQEIKQNVGIYNKSICAVVKDNTSNVSNIVIEVNDELFNFRDANGVISNTDIIDRVISFFNDNIYISDYDNYKSSGETNYHIITIDEFLQKNNDIYYSGISDMSEQFVKLNIGTYNRDSNLYKYNI